MFIYMTSKTKKAMLKRIKITGSGKLLHRRTGQGHFNSKDRGKVTMHKRQKFMVAKTDEKAVKNLLSH